MHQHFTTPFLVTRAAFAVTGFPIALSCAHAFEAPSNQAAESRPYSKWERQNKALSVAAGGLNQRYTEYDAYGLASDGILNTERGTTLSGAVQYRWQGAAGVVPLWAQVQAQRSAGRTSYQGYLQTGNTLRAYSAKTGNVLGSTSIRIGIPFALNENLQVVPVAEIGWHRWRRELVQYEEVFAHRSYSMGVMGQWQAGPRWFVEGGVLSGRTAQGEISIARFAFSAELQEKRTDHLQLAVSFLVAPSWSTGMQWELNQYRHGASSIVNNLQYPDSKTTQQRLTFRLAYQY